MPKKATQKKDAGKQPGQQISFEDALAELEDITRKLESGQLSLDDSIKAYERGMELRKICQWKLNEAEARVDYLRRKEDGTLEPGPVELETADMEKSGQSRLFQN
ncbi:MAG: exodeoxyribonuclease VII small subunit [Leptospiraceae bacterium]|nr:exodeoxyribonuclease VII small subunit [Leptospiraceae bacterium]